MRPIDPALDPLVADVVLPLRAERQSTRIADGSLQPHWWYDHTCPVIVDGFIIDNGCPFPRFGFVSNGPGYEWSDQHQVTFQEVVTPHLDLDRWDALVTEMRSHWVNGMDRWGVDEIPWMTALAPGVRPVLHELGKSPEFRTLRHLPFDEDDKRGTFKAVTLNDRRLEGWPPVPSRHRAALIAARGMIEWYSQRYTDTPWETQTCMICGDVFWPNLLDSTALQRMGPPRYCAPCVRMAATDVWGLGLMSEDILKPLLIAVAQELYEVTGVFPHQSIKLTPIGVLDEGERDTWIRLLMLMPRPDTAKEIFGSWREYLHAADMLDGAPRKGQSGYVTIANDGHISLSIGERLVCDWLHHNGIPHEKEPEYPAHPTLNPGRKLRADWLIGDCWVELAGRMTDTKYAEKMTLKQQLAQEAGLRHLILLPAEVRRLEPIARAHWEWNPRK